MRLIDRDVVPALGFPMGRERLVEINVKLAGWIVRDVEQRDVAGPCYGSRQHKCTECKNGKDSIKRFHGHFLFNSSFQNDGRSNAETQRRRAELIQLLNARFALGDFHLLLRASAPLRSFSN